MRRRDGDTLYYTLEFTVRSPSFFRHNLSVYAARCVSRITDGIVKEERLGSGDWNCHVHAGLASCMSSTGAPLPL